MVREELAKYLNTTVKIEATFIKESVSKGGKFKTVLLRQIFLQETKTFVTDDTVKGTALAVSYKVSSL